MEAFHHTFLPRRLTQIYTDTKKSYEQVVRANQRRSNSQSASTDRKLRIQKDRLIAWGLEWADSRAGDIDDSLDRAGISDLVESIMTSINELLDEAERLQPSTTLVFPGSFPGPFPGSFPDDKSAARAAQEVDQSDKDIARLDDIVRDLTTSIDTLCDLSRSQQGLRQPLSSQNARPAQVEMEGKAKKRVDVNEHSYFLSNQETGSFNPYTGPMPASYIEFHLLRIPRNMTAGSSPPSYETVAASSDDRIPAFLQDSCSEVPVLLEYTSILDSSSSTDSLARRFKELAESLRVSPRSPNDPKAYVGAMELVGWFQDPRQSRYGLVYKAPEVTTQQTSHHLGPRSSVTQSQQSENLLSFLQHSADTDIMLMPSLEDRFRLAYNLASSLFHFHANGTTHRNINSSNVMFFFSKSPAPVSKDSKPWKEGVIRKPFLASFDQSDEDAHDPQEEPFISSIYRHPRTTRGQRSTFEPAYDLYSLGIILIEIGLWMPISRMWKTRYSRSDFKVRLQSLYIKKLIAKCGTTYMRVVESCLRAADESTRERTRPARSRTDIYWNVLKPLEKCCMIDDEKEIEHDLHAGFFEARKLSDHQGSIDEDHGLTPVHLEEPLTPRKSETPDRPAEPSVKDSAESLNAHTDEKKISPQNTKAAKKQPCKCQVWSHELPAACSAYWNGTMAPKLDRILQKAVDRWESYSIDLFMSGETPEAARPTIYMMCASTDKARKVLQFLNRDKNLFDIKVVKGQITRSKAGKRRRPAKKGKKSASAQSGPPKDLCYRRYQQRPACGASIGAYFDNHHLPPVSFGGTVLVDGNPYGMSVHHMLENEDVDMGLDQAFDLNRSMAPISELADDDTSSIHSYSVDLPEALYPFEIEDDEDEGYQSESDAEAWLSEILESEELTPHGNYDEEIDMGDTAGIEPGHGGELIVTQPAIDDVDEGFFPNEEDMDDEHLSSHSLGHIFASSGIKRSRRGAIAHEVDWALIKMKTQRVQTRNIVAGGARHCNTRLLAHPSDADKEASFPSEVKRTEELGGLEVHALGRTSGLQAGRILPAMSMIKMPGRISSSHSWTVMGNFGAGGDSGAWVIDNATNCVCAHVLAFSERNNTAYISPMEVLLEDMERRLKASVTLPSHSCSSLSSIVDSQHPTSSPSGTISRPTSALGTSLRSPYSPPDTPPPSPPQAQMSSLRLLDNDVSDERSADTKKMGQITSGYRPPKRTEKLDKDRAVTGPSVNARELKRRSGGIQAGG